MADETGAIASAAITQLGNYAVQVASNKRQFKYQQQAMAKQQEYNKDLWDYQNAYNTPQAQMERLKAAGLNPRLIYGSGSANTGNAGPIAPTEVPSRQAATPEIPDVFMRGLITRQYDAQYAATMQNMEVMRTSAALKDIQTANETIKNMEQRSRSKYFPQLALAESRLKNFMSFRAKELNYNEQKKGEVLGQLYELRQEQITSQKLDNAFKSNRNALAQYGIYQSDHPLLRIFMQSAQRQGINLHELLGQGPKALQYLVDLVK